MRFKVKRVDDTESKEVSEDTKRDKEQKPEEMTYSRLSTWLTCSMLEYYRYRVNGRGIELKEPFIPFLEGELGHYALYHYYNQGHMLRENMVKRVGKMLQPFREDGLDPELDDQIIIKLAAMIGATQGYKIKYRDSFTPLAAKGNNKSEGEDEVLFLETESSFEIADTKFLFKVDRITRSRKTGKLRLWENKFVSSVTANKYRVLPLDLQGLLYCEGCKVLTGEYPDEKCWDFIIKSQLRRKGSIEKGNLEPLSSFEARVTQQYLDSDDKFFRPPPINVIPRALESLRSQLEIILGYWRKMASTPYMNFSQCEGPYGRPCPFVPACSEIMLGHTEGWSSPACQGLYKLKDKQHQEYGKEGYDNDKATKK